MTGRAFKLSKIEQVLIGLGMGLVIETWLGQLIPVPAAFLSILSIFIQYLGTAGISATTRLYPPLFWTAKVFAVPLMWNWGKTRSRGVLNSRIQTIAIQEPVFNYYLTELDVFAFAEY